jgi:hypothetical protein
MASSIATIGLPGAVDDSSWQRRAAQLERRPDVSHSRKARTALTLALQSVRRKTAVELKLGWLKPLHEMIPELAVKAPLHQSVR